MFTHQETVPGSGRVIAAAHSAARDVGPSWALQPLSGHVWPGLGAGSTGSPPARASTSHTSQQKPGNVRLCMGESWGSGAAHPHLPSAPHVLAGIPGLVASISWVPTLPASLLHLEAPSEAPNMTLVFAGSRF